MSDLKVRPPKARNARLRLARRAEARRYALDYRSARMATSNFE